jgi:hypothetical protein
MVNNASEENTASFFREKYLPFLFMMLKSNVSRIGLYIVRVERVESCSYFS